MTKWIGLSSSIRLTRQGMLGYSSTQPVNPLGQSVGLKNIFYAFCYVLNFLEGFWRVDLPKPTNPTAFLAGHPPCPVKAG